MRFIFITLLAFLPLTAMAGDRVTSRDITDIYEYVDATFAGNSCKAVSEDGAKTCQITCVEWENAKCSGGETTATCVCQVPSPPPKDTAMLK